MARSTIRIRDCTRVGASVLLGLLTVSGCRAQDAEGPPTIPGTVSLLPGQGAAVAGATTLRLDGGAMGSENVLIVVDTSTTSVSTRLAYQIAATSLAAPGSVSAPSTVRLPELGGGGGVGDRSSASATSPVLDVSFGVRLNERARSRLIGGFRAARATVASGARTPQGATPSRALADPQVGDYFPINVGSRACDSVVTRTARVAAIGTRSIVLADTINPSGGFTTADYQRFAARFDTLVYPLDVANFGAPADIDKNSRIVLLFTSAVNELTPRNSTSYVGGFFFDRDLFPVLSTPDFEGCAGSNFGELFYLLAPDPTGLVNGNVRRTGFVDSITTAVIAHEFQHLINSSRRLYVNSAFDFETTWLNEGLSHIAEELLFYRESKLSPKSNVDITALRSSPAVRSAYNADMASNTARYALYLENPSESSPILLDDSLSTRGAIWNYLRWATDRKLAGGGTESAVWQSLVNSRERGATNLRAVYGADLGAWLRDWSVSHYTDDFATSVAAAETQPSWNFRSIFPALTGGGNRYPLKVLTLTEPSASGTLLGGSAAYYRFAIPAGATATITVTGSPLLDARVIRLR
jgi:hypothetical protein